MYQNSLTTDANVNKNVHFLMLSLTLMEAISCLKNQSMKLQPREEEKNRISSKSDESPDSCYRPDSYS